MLNSYIDTIISVDTFDQLCCKIKDFDNKEKGDIFELLTMYIFLLHPNYANTTEHIYLYSDIPIKIKEHNNLPKKDKGIDLLLKTKDGDFYPIQCKFRLDTNKTVNWGSLATFVGQSFGIANFKKAIYVTNTFDIDEEIMKSDKIDLIYGDFFDSLNKEFFNNIRNKIKGKDISYKQYTPLDHQVKFINQSLKHYENNDRGVAVMSCGSGKTFSAYKLDREMGNHLTLVLVPSLYLLSQLFSDWAREYVNESDVKFILVGSDCDIDCNYKANGIFVTTNELEIKQKLNNYTKDYDVSKVIIISTYQSAERLKPALKKKTVDLIIFDEAHKTVGSNGLFQFALYDENIKAHLRLFLTATPRIYGDTKKIKDDDYDDDCEIVSMDNELIYGKQYFSYNIREAIDDGILCEYEILLMYITENQLDKYKQDNKLVNVNNDTIGFHYLATAMMIDKLFKKKDINHLLTYHASIKNSKDFKSLLIDVVDKKVDVNQIDGNDSAKRKNDLIRDFKKYDSAVLTSARVLNEGVNIPIIDSVCFVESRNSAIDIVQCVGRALRKYDGKKKASIIIPVLESEMDGKSNFDNLIKVIKNLGEYDDGIKDYFMTSREGKKTNRKMIRIENYGDNQIDCGVKLDLEVIGDKIETMILDAVYRWDVMLEKVMKYIDENDKLPSTIDKNKEIQQIGRWNSSQIINYKNNINSMKDLDKKHKWEELIMKYNKYYISNKEEWYNKLLEVKQYISKYKTKPYFDDKDKEIQKLGKWIYSQTKNYKNKVDIMKNSDIQKKWEEFIIEYKQYFISNEEEWYNNLLEVKQYINKNKKKPSRSDKNKDIIKLGQWITMQLVNYKKEKCIMKDLNIRKKWEDFISEYKEYFISDDEEWHDKLKNVETYINENNKRPSNHDKNKNISILGGWIHTQLLNYEKKQGLIQNNDIKKRWEEFIIKYKKYFISIDDEWQNKLKEVEKYIIENNKRPSTTDDNLVYKQLGAWIIKQKINYKKNIHSMKNENNRKSWEEFMLKYKKYFLSNEEEWKNKLTEVEKYIIENNKRPSISENNEDIKKMGRWIHNNIIIYKERKQIMMDIEIYKLWEDFVIKYKQYFPNVLKK